MDIKCANCQEPWSVDHLLHDAVWETELPEDIKQNWNPAKHLKMPEVKLAFEKAGYRYHGDNILALLRCPCCLEREQDDCRAAERSDMQELYEVAADIFGDDIDGFAAEIEDFEAMFGS